MESVPFPYIYVTLNSDVLFIGVSAISLHIRYAMAVHEELGTVLAYLCCLLLFVISELLPSRGSGSAALLYYQWRMLTASFKSHADVTSN
jgi:hypothetical protein